METLRFRQGIIAGVLMTCFYAVGTYALLNPRDRNVSIYPSSTPVQKAEPSAAEQELKNSLERVVFNI